VRPLSWPAPQVVFAKREVLDFVLPTLDAVIDRLDHRDLLLADVIELRAAVYDRLEAGGPHLTS
jgi:hypothetical protein